MALSIEEQEVSINFTRPDKRANIYVSDTRYINKLNKLVEKSDEWEKIEEVKAQGELVGIVYSCPIEFISFRAVKRTLNITDEQRAAISERFSKGREVE